VLQKQLVTRTIKSVGRGLGLDIHRSKKTIGDMESFLAHLRGVGFLPAAVLDVGANRADWSRLARTYFPQAKFILIEPQIEMRPDLDAFCSESAGSAWKLAGAGREPGEKTLTVWPNFAGSSMLTVPDDNQLERRAVPIITIDSLFTGDEPLPQLAKLDIQGFELEALSSATKLFGHTECFIVETNLVRPLPQMPTFAEVVAFFDAQGYRAYDFPGYLRRPFDNAVGQVDVAFVRKGGMLDNEQRW
jgi:FkbM family methyltransferase